MADRKRLIVHLESELKDARLAWEAEKLCYLRPAWRKGLGFISRGRPLHDALLDMPRSIVTRMQAALAAPRAAAQAVQAADDDEVEVTGEKSWAERDRELRAAAVVLE